MAVFGYQLCFTLIMATFLQKITPIYSLGRWLLANGSLVWYQHPSDAELRKAAGKPVTKKTNGKLKNRKSAKPKLENDVFKIPKNIEIALDIAPVQPVDLMTIRRYPDFEWLIDYALISILVYIGTEIYYELFNPEHELNISIIWIGLLAWFSMKNLMSIFWMYVKSRAGGEVSMSVVFGMISFIVSLAVSMVKEDHLELGLEYTGKNYSFLNQTNKFPVTGVKIGLAIWSAIIGLLFMFPAVRMAQMYVDSLKFNKGNLIKTVGLHVNFFAPIVICLLWIKPIARDVVMNPSFGKLEEASPLVTQGQFELLRISFVILVCILRLTMIRVHLQAYLNLAHERVRKVKRESGLITNTEYQRNILQIFWYVGIVATQYICPLVLLLCSSLLLKTLGCYSWTAISANNENIMLKSANFSMPFNNPLLETDSHMDMVQKIRNHIETLQTLLSPPFIRGICSYMLWWIASNWFVASCVGLLYHTHLTE